MKQDYIVLNIDRCSNGIQRCAHCGIPITLDNDSGWEVFVGDGKHSQPICGWCDAEMTLNSPTGKSEEKAK